MSEPMPLEWCRECRDEATDLERPEEHTIRPAVVIIWGKLFPPEALGPKCEEHAVKHVPYLDFPTLGQWAVFDLRGLVRQPSNRPATGFSQPGSSTPARRS